MNTIETKLKNIETLVACKTINGTSFVGVRNYENKQGEISNQTFLVGINYASLLEKDLNTLKAFDIKTMFINEDTTHNDKPVTKEKYNETVLKGYTELLNSLTKRTASEFEKAILRASNDSTINRSDAQSEAFENVAKGLKTKEESLYIYGLSVKKTVLVKGDYPSKTSQLKTVIKNKITKATELRGGKYKQFKLGALEELNIQGFTI